MDNLVLASTHFTAPLSCQERVVKKRPLHHVLLPEVHVPETGSAKVSLLGHLLTVVNVIL